MMSCAEEHELGKSRGTYMGPFGAWYDKRARDPHEYCPAEDSACYLSREDECPAFADEREDGEEQAR
jgi:hypothetical protein